MDTGDGWGPNARKTIERLKPACAVLRFGDLAGRPFDWPDLARDAPEDLAFRHEPFRLRPHQQAAFDDVLAGFRDHDRGKLVMACGAGKTFTVLRIAEAVAGAGGRVLYLVPSISLFSQSMREWATQRAIAHRYVGVCSDTRAGLNDEDASLQELEIPVTTDPPSISAALREAAEDALTVVFCTYHSLGVVERAQDEGAPPFDLVLCDEAHRTTGVERPGDRTSPFVLVHDGERVRAARRLYMTATPRLYTESAKAKAASHDVDVFSMDDPETYGPELHRLPFSRAVDQGLLSDYKVVVLAMSEQHVDAALQAHLAAGESEINLTDAAKITGCWRALQNPENQAPGGEPVRRLHFIAFGQCFPRYRYEQPDDVQGQLPGMGGGPGTSGPERIDNVTDTALRAFRVRYADDSIDKDDVFDYIYGVLHAPDWRGRFAADLVKELPRVPFAEDFRTFARAGRALAALHLGYETCEEHPLETVFTQSGASRPEHFRIGARAMRWSRIFGQSVNPDYS